MTPSQAAAVAELADNGMGADAARYLLALSARLLPGQTVPALEWSVDLDPDTGGTYDPGPAPVIRLACTYATATTWDSPAEQREAVASMLLHELAHHAVELDGGDPDDHGTAYLECVRRFAANLGLPAPATRAEATEWPYVGLHTRQWAAPTLTAALRDPWPAGPTASAATATKRN